MKSPGWIISLTVLLLVQCAPLNKMNYANLAYLYEPESNPSNFRLIAYHISHEQTIVHYQFDMSALLYQKNNNSQNYVSNFSIRYRLFDSFNSRMMVDSATFLFSDSLYFGSDQVYTSSFNLRTIYPGRFVLNISLEDLNRKSNYNTYLELFKSSENSRQNFLILDESGMPLYDEWTGPQQIIRIRYNKPELEKLYVSYFRNDFPIASPPFVEGKKSGFEYKADSLYEVDVMNGETGLMILESEGIYHFQADTSTREGFTVFRYNDGFPAVLEAGQMLLPLRYLTTSKEYERIEAHNDVLGAVEDFWLKHAGNVDRAKILIRKYYTRVQYANRSFSSYLEGWKTDRGMIYIVFGPPSVVYRQNNVEQWIYGEEGNIMSITFNFVKFINPFTENDYMLDRSARLKEPWYMAVDGWRR
jgi:GWxTD domain-containing protein